MLSVVLTLFAASDVYQAESVASSCECDNTAAIIGGVVAVVFIVTAAVTTVVVILRSCRGHYSTPKTRTRYYITSVYQTVLIQLSVYRELADVPAATDQALELSKFSEATYV